MISKIIHFISEIDYNGYLLGGISDARLVPKTNEEGVLREK